MKGISTGSMRKRNMPFARLSPFESLISWGTLLAAPLGKRKPRPIRAFPAWPVTWAGIRSSIQEGQAPRKEQLDLLGIVPNLLNILY